MQEFIRTLQGRPHHERQRIAYSAAGGITAVIAVMWLGVSLYSGRFEIKQPTVADLDRPALSAGNQDSSSFLAGAAAALTGATTAPATLQIVDTGRSSTLDQQATTSATVIPF